jgi:hypothetical protein
MHSTFSIWDDLGCVYLSVVAMALANKKTGQMAITTIIAKATSSDTKLGCAL